MRECIFRIKKNHVEKKSNETMDFIKNYMSMR